MGIRRGRSSEPYTSRHRADRFAQTVADHCGVKMPLLGILADEQNELQTWQKRHQSLAPQFGAFPARRQVAAVGVKAGETEAHSHDGDDLRIVEDLFVNPEPAAQPHARRISIWAPRSMRADTRRLTDDAEARGG